MGYDKLVRDAVRTAHRLTGGVGGLQVDVEFEQWIASDENGQPEYATPKTLEAIVELQTLMPRPALATGKHVTPRAKVLLLSLPKAHGAADRTEPIDARDRFVLPDGTVCHILSISGVVDPLTDAPYAVELWVG